MAEPVEADTGLPLETGRPRVFLASRNAKKIEEMRRILDELLPGIEVLVLDDVAAYDDPVEDQSKFEGNALL
ncbi:MAG: purine phosphatase, partial [Marmoricola sp.]|nr:purine phosphatase [Marmoricola sp.]